MNSLATSISIRRLMRIFEPHLRPFLAAHILPLIMASLFLGAPFLAAQSAGILLIFFLPFSYLGLLFFFHFT